MEEQTEVKTLTLKIKELVCYHAQGFLLASGVAQIVHRATWWALSSRAFVCPALMGLATVCTIVPC